MPALNVRNLSVETHRALRIRAAQHGRSTEAEVRAILDEAVRPKAPVRLGTLLAQIGQDFGGVELAIARDKAAVGARPFRMIILDTNVISEPLRAQANAAVTAWLDAQDFETLYITSVTLAELLTGLDILPLGQRRSALEARLSTVLGLFPPARVLPFDTAAARFFALLMARAKATGQAIGFADGQIAAIAGVNGFAVAARDVGPFMAAGVAVVNPWE